MYSNFTKFYVRKTTNPFSLPSKNWPKSPTRVQEWDPPFSEFRACEKNTLITLINIIIIMAGHAGRLHNEWKTGGRKLYHTTQKEKET
jgi:hypothetical protein